MSKLNGRQPKPKVVIEFYPKFDEWYLFIVVDCRDGTHEGYDILYNSQCVRNGYFKTFIQAAQKAEKILKADSDSWPT